MYANTVEAANTSQSSQTKKTDGHLPHVDGAMENRAGLEQELRQVITGEVRFDDGARALYATDASNYRQVPIGVVIPKTEQDIIKTVSICNKYKVPLLSRGGGTSLAGQCCNVAVVMDMSKYYNKVLHIDKENKLVSVQPGIVLDAMRKATQQAAGLTFGPDPATHNHCTIGGMLGNNSCGIHSVMAALYGYGARTSDNTFSLTIVTYDGIKMKVGPTSDEMYEEIVAAGGPQADIYKALKAFVNKYADLIREKFPNIPRRVSGYNLPELLPENGFNVARALVGSESTCVTILEATMQLITTPGKRTVVVLGYPDIYEAGYAVPEILQFKPTALEGIDDLLIDYMRKKGLNTSDIPLLPDGKGWLIVEFGADNQEEADKKAHEMMDGLKKKDKAPSMRLFDDKEDEGRLWEIRESGLGATAWVPGEPMGAPGWEDSAVDPNRVGDYLKDLRALFDKYGYHPSLYGHFGQGCIHCRIQFDLFNEPGIIAYKNFTQEAAKLVVKYGGSLSGEHGDGQSRGDLLEIMYGKEMIQAFREFKAIWDPAGKMNPGKIIDTYGQLSDLRIGSSYNPPQLDTFFAYSNDNYDFAQATLRCVGVGKCRRHEGGTMCPSYMVTHEEEHSTRGRAHMLFEMMQGDELKKGWKTKPVKDSLDLCLACKGCKSDCPVNVDMATYKAEFLAHYYKGKLRPRSAYAFGWIYWWSRMASLMPGVANFFLHAPVLKRIVKAIAGVAPQRDMPRFADITFKEWFSINKNKNNHTAYGKPKVILWADTFNNHFLPQTLVAGKDVLEAAGFEVVVPRQSLCCGRPLYDFGMLKTAKRMLHEILDVLQEEIRAGVPIVGLEPSCVAVFRDELCEILPHNQDAQRLKSNVFTLAEFLQKKAPGFKLPGLDQKVILHGHCHHKAVMKMDCDKELLNKAGIEFNMPDAGCCGMAGYFGYLEGDQYEVSVQAGERVLLPAVRKAGANDVIVADGFSCREQIEQETGHKALHLAQLLQKSLHEKNARQNSAAARQYTGAMPLKHPHKTRNRLLYGAAFTIALVTTFLIKKNNR